MPYSVQAGAMRIVFILVFSLIALLILACSKTEDLRVVLCQDLTQALLNSAQGFVVHEHNVIMNAYDDLEIRLIYSKLQTDGTTLDQQSSCFYAYVEDEIGMETFNTPTSAYATYPSKMIFNKKELQPRQLAPIIEQIMLNKGAAAINKIKQNINQQVEAK